VRAVLAEEKLLKGTTIGVDATTLEANAALRSIVRRDSGERYEEFLTGWRKRAASIRPRASSWPSWIASVRRRDRATTGHIRTIPMRASPR
jgi:hypothetical protein